MMFLEQSLYSLTDLNRVIWLLALFQRYDKTYIRINAYPSNSLDIRSLAHAIYMLSGYVSKTEHLGSLVFKVTMVGHVVADGNSGSRAQNFQLGT